MAHKRDLEVVISPDGEISIKVSGFPGKQCLKVREAMEAEVGVLRSQRLTSEYYQPEQPVDMKLRNRR